MKKHNEKTGAYEDEEIFGARLFLDDVEQIVDQLRASDLEVKIVDSAYEYDDVDELQQKRGGSPATMSIVGSRRGAYASTITIAMGMNLLGFGRELRIRLYSLKSDPDLERLWYRLRDQLKGAAPWYNRVMTRPGYWVMASCWVVSLTWWARESFPVVHLAWMSIGALTLVSFVYARAYKPIVLRRRHEGFWSRYGERLVLIILGAAIAEGVRVLGAVLKNAPGGP